MRPHAFYRPFGLEDETGMARPPRSERIEPVLDKPQEADEGEFDIRLGADDRPAGGSFAPRVPRERGSRERASQERSEPGFGQARGEPGFGAERQEPGFSASRSEPGFGKAGAGEPDDVDWDDSSWGDAPNFDADERSKKTSARESAKASAKASAGERREPGMALERTGRKREKPDPDAASRAGRERR